MFNIVLFEPEIPPNTGNIMRLSANSGCRLHLIEPLGFSLDEKQVRRAGMDYRDIADIRVHGSLPQYLETLPDPSRVFPISTRGTRRYCDIRFVAGDVFLFGPETRGLPDTLLNGFPADQRLRVPMRAGCRSLNLSNTVALLVYEAWRQNDFSGGA